MKKFLILFLVMLMSISIIACENEIVEIPDEPEEDPIKKVVMVTSEGGLGDKSFNDRAYEGVLRASSDFEIEVSIKEPETRSDYISSLASAAEEGASLVLAVGYVPKNDIKEIGEQYPDTSFAVVDSEDEVTDNVMSIAFRDQEGAYLVGIIAALTTETDIVGFVGGTADPTMDKFEYGFRAGVKTINPNAQVLIDYTGSYENTNLGEIAAKTLIDQGADVIFHASGECGLGVIETASEMGIWVIGVDQDQSSLSPEAVLCSMFKCVDNGAYFAIQNIVEGKFEGGVYEFGLDFEAVGYVDGANNLPKDVKKVVDEYKKAIISGEIYVPKDRGGFEGFGVPEGGLL